MARDQVPLPPASEESTFSGSFFRTLANPSNSSGNNDRHGGRLLGGRPSSAAITNLTFAMKSSIVRLLVPLAFAASVFAAQPDAGAKPARSPDPKAGRHADGEPGAIIGAGLGAIAGDQAAPPSASTASGGISCSVANGQGKVAYKGQEVWKGKVEHGLSGTASTINGTELAAAFDGDKVVWENVSGAAKQLKPKAKAEGAPKKP